MSRAPESGVRAVQPEWALYDLQPKNRDALTRSYAAAGITI